MKLPFTLTARLFIAVFSTAMAVALAMGVFSHINLNRDFIGYLNEQAVNRLELARTSVTAGYRENGRSWDFLRQKPELWGRLLRDYPAAQVVPFALLVPFIGSGASAVVFGERFGPLRMTGMLTVVCGIAVMLLLGRPRAPVLVEGA